LDVPVRRRFRNPSRDLGDDASLGFPSFSVLSMSEVTHILDAIEHGDPHAAAHLLPLVYEELRKLAAEKMANERPG
jgi:DNA-binding GntR family transcriptional regulator